MGPLLGGKGVGWGVEVARVHNSVSCFARCKKPVFLHDIAKSIGRFLLGCPSQLVCEVLGVPRRAVFKQEGTWSLSSLSLTLFQ